MCQVAEKSLEEAKKSFDGFVAAAQKATMDMDQTTGSGWRAKGERKASEFPRRDGVCNVHLGPRLNSGPLLGGFTSHDPHVGARLGRQAAPPGEPVTHPPGPGHCKRLPRGQDFRKAAKKWHAMLGHYRKSHAPDGRFAQATATQAGAKDFGKKAIAFAEQNVATSFEFAQKLARAKNAEEIMRCCRPSS